MPVPTWISLTMHALQRLLRIINKQNLVIEKLIGARNVLIHRLDLRNQDDHRLFNPITKPLDKYYEKHLMFEQTLIIWSPNWMTSHNSEKRYNRYWAQVNARAVLTESQVRNKWSDANIANIVHTIGINLIDFEGVVSKARMQSKKTNCVTIAVTRLRPQHCFCLVITFMWISLVVAQHNCEFEFSLIT